MTTKPLPPPYIPVVGPDGKMVRQWWEYFESRDNLKVSDLRDVYGAPTNGQVLVWNSTDGKYEPGAN